MTRTPGFGRRRFLLGAAGFAGSAAVLAACGSGGGDGGSGDGGSGVGAPASAPGELLTTGGRDLGGVTLNAASQIETNPLPDLIVDDVGRRKKVNLRNIFPAERPVLIWMWAPH